MISVAITFGFGGGIWECFRCTCRCSFLFLIGRVKFCLMLDSLFKDGLVLNAMSYAPLDEKSIQRVFRRILRWPFRGCSRFKGGLGRFLEEK